MLNSSLCCTNNVDVHKKTIHLCRTFFIRETLGLCSLMLKGVCRGWIVILNDQQIREFEGIN